MTRNDGLVIGTTKVVDNGPRSLRFNLVIMGDGYQATEMANYASNVSQFVSAMLATPPYDEVGSAINIYRVDVISTDSGADDPLTSSCAGSGATARTYFDASFCGVGGLQRALTVDNSTAVLTALAEVPELHAVLVVVNSMIYGGTGGVVATYSLASGAEQIAFHELGHSVFHLADEYESYQGCSSGEMDHNNYPTMGGEPAESNVTINTNLATLKWRRYVAASTNIPTMSNPDCTKCDPRPSLVPVGTVGLFEGAKTYHCKCFRPEFNCKMRTLNAPFCRVCREQVRAVLTPYGRDSWESTDLSALVVPNAAAAGDPVVYVTDFAGQGPTARVVYRAAGTGNVYELSYSPSTGAWTATDLTTFVAGAAAAAGDPVVYVTDFAGQGPTARVVYRAAGTGNVYELSYSPSTGAWTATDLTTFVAGAAAAAGDPVVYVTDFAGQGPTARVVYRAAGTGNVYELSYSPSTGAWTGTDLTAVSGAPAAIGEITAHTTDLPGQGPTARVVYRSAGVGILLAPGVGNVYELSYSPSTGAWTGTDLTAVSGAPAAVGEITAYTTDLPRQGPTTRVVYPAAGWPFEKVYELSYSPSTGAWTATDLTAIGIGAPAAAGKIKVYTTDFTDQRAASHLVYRSSMGDVLEVLHIEARLT